MSHDVFISHAAEDAAIAVAVCGLLETHRIPCWIAPRNVPSAAEFGETIVGAVEKSRLLLLLLSTAANASRFVMREVSLALESDIAILPFRLEDVVPGKNLKFFLQGLQRFDGFPSPLEDNVRDIIPFISAAIEEGPVTQEDQSLKQDCRSCATAVDEAAVPFDAVNIARTYSR